MPWPLIQRIGELGVVGEDIVGHGCPGLDPIACGLLRKRQQRHAHGVTHRVLQHNTSAHQASRIQSHDQHNRQRQKRKVQIQRSITRQRR